MTSPTSGSELSHRCLLAGRRPRARTRAYVLSIVANRRHVTHLSPRADLLSVHVDAGPRVVGHAVQVAAVHVRDVAAEDVGHGDVRRGHPCVTERQVEHRAQVLLELAGARPLDRPVAAVVRAHGELVDEHAGSVEHLDSEHPGDAEALGDAQGGLLGGQRVVLRDGAGANTSRQMPSTCTVSTTG